MITGLLDIDMKTTPFVLTEVLNYVLGFSFLSESLCCRRYGVLNELVKRQFGIDATPFDR